MKKTLQVAGFAVFGAVVFAIAQQAAQAVQPGYTENGADARWAKRDEDRKVASVHQIQGTLVCEATGACQLKDSTNQTWNLVGTGAEDVKRMFQSGIKSVKLEGTQPEKGTFQVAKAERM